MPARLKYSIEDLGDMFPPPSVLSRVPEEIPGLEKAQIDQNIKKGFDGLSENIDGVMQHYVSFCC